MIDPLLGTTVGSRYLLAEVVGQGGMGIVYRAEDTRLHGRPCAVKLLTGRSADPEEVRRFERELNIIARLRSQHVVQVLDAGALHDGRRYIVMELLEGLPLSQLLKRTGPLAPERAVNLIKGVLAGLSEAHDHGVVHRDLKPANVFVTRSRTGTEVAKVLDFGIAKDTAQSNHAADLTAASMLIGTPKYMAPEQFLKQPADNRTDLYAVGLLLYQMLAGTPPFTAEMPVPDTIATMPPEFRIGWLHINQFPAPLQLPPGLWDILMGLLGKEPDHRWADAAHVIDALVALEHSGRVPEPLPELAQGRASPTAETASGTTGFPVAGESLTGLPAEPTPSKKGPLMAVAALVAALAGAGVWWAVKGPGDAPTATKAGICLHAINSSPTGALVRQGPNSIGVTPLTVERPCREVWMVEVERKGYETQKVTLRGKGAREDLNITLDREVRAPSAPVTQAAPAPQAPAPKAEKPEPRRAEPRRAERPAPKAEKPEPRKAERPAPTQPRPAAKPEPKPAPTPKAPATQAPKAPATQAPAGGNLFF
ncbi:MAG: serine/threonine protein kinase [Myxococcales bacterium]|nr:serine/threonine protein kinase [Myxococcales bacterium]